MKNLKKVLALVLAFACAFTMFAGAAFTDSADIKVDADVVDTLVSLGVVNGYDDGSFKPNGTVTRAEMAKMIYVLRTGNSDASAYNDDKTSFTDIGSHWARGYIKYCQSLGIIAGKSNTKFCPNDKVTAQEAAKMLLVTLGYNAEKAGLVGANWASRTNALADEAGLLEDVNTSFTSACPRQYAAQLIYNAIDTPTVVWRDDAYTNVTLLGDDNKTIGEKYMGLNTVEGVLSAVEKDTDRNTYTANVNNITKKNGNPVKTVYSEQFTKIAKDYTALKNQKVKVLYKGTDEVYGIFALTSANLSVSDVMGNVKIDGGKLKIDGKKYTIDSNTKVVVDGETIGTETTDNGKKVFTATNITTWVTANAEGKNIGKASEVTAVSNDDNNKIDVLTVKTFKTKKVTYVGKDYITAGTKLEAEKYNYSSDIKKDDYVAISEAGNYADDKGLAEKAEVVEGKVTGTKGSDKVEIGDNWYEADYKSGTTLIDKFPAMGAYVKLVVVNGYVQIVDTITAGSQDVALVIETGSATGLGSSKVADVLFADGTRKTVELDKASYGYGHQYTTPVLASYEVSKGEYTFTQISTGNKVGYDDYKDLNTNVQIDGKATATEGTVYFDSAAVAFVKSEGDKYKVVTGKDVANWSKKTVAGVEALTKTTSGSAYAQIAFVDLGDAKVPGGSNTTYAFALDDSYSQTIDGTKYTMVKAWNGTEEVTFKSEDSVTLSAREAFEYAANSDGTVSLTKLSDKNDVNAKYAVAQVTQYDEASGDIAFNQAALGKSKINKDTVVLYVDSDAKTGAEGGEIRVAENVDGSANGSIENNVIVYSEKDDESIALLVVDINNEMKQ